MSYREKNDIDTVLKFLVIGNTGVGKTCFLLRFCEDTFTNVHLTTIGINKEIVNLIVCNIYFSLAIIKI
jgi:Ras-related protein Rab-8A